MVIIILMPKLELTLVQEKTPLYHHSIEKSLFLVVVSMTLLWSYSAEWIFYNIMLAWGTSKFFKIWRNGSFPRHANLFCISLYSFMWNEMSKIHNFCLIETTLRLICNWLCCILSNTWRSFDHAPFLSSCISRYH